MCADGQILFFGVRFPHTELNYSVFRLQSSTIIHG